MYSNFLCWCVRPCAMEESVIATTAPSIITYLRSDVRADPSLIYINRSNTSHNRSEMYLSVSELECNSTIDHKSHNSIQTLSDRGTTLNGIVIFLHNAIMTHHLRRPSDS